MGCTNSSAAKGTSNGNPGNPRAPPAKAAKPTFKEMYELKELLGQGSYSIVRLAERKTDKKTFAVKIVPKAQLSRQDEMSLRSEVELMLSLDHPNIVKAYEFFDEDNYFFLILEHLEGGELFERLVEKVVYTEKEARDLAKILLNAIKYCHDKGLIHRDIKPENVLLASKTDDINLKLADFGFAVKSDSAPIKKQAGTPGYIAPEILLKRPQTYAVDMWSFGVVLFLLLGGYPPFYNPGDEIKDIYRKILNADYQFHPSRWDAVSAEAKDLVKRLLSLDVENRPTVDQALSHAWFNKDSTELTVRNLNTNLAALKDFRAAWALQAGVVAGAAIDAIRKVSTSSIGKSVSIKDVSIDVMRKLSGANMNDAVIEAARKRSGANLSSKNILAEGSARKRSVNGASNKSTGSGNSR